MTPWRLQASVVAATVVMSVAFAWAQDRAAGNDGSSTAAVAISLVPAKSLPREDRRNDHLSDAQRATSSTTVPGEIRYRGVGVRLSPPAAGDTPALTAAAALSVIAGGVRPDVPMRGHAPTFYLARFSNDQMGPMDGAGRVHPLYQDRLAWIITYPDVPVEAYGPPGAPTPSLACPFVYAVDALSPQLLSAFQDCVGQAVTSPAKPAG